ncbi:hypothetical protein FOIG_02050 [Fusarium odoratissimum NRRL 54006]|uniref:Uncharacterized protein n=2 Tax=Fusarium oxysporum species complex TaxID=171631 RepID=X0KJZ2_FUSO5|nr:uncharacterized protein FOIG_02050 [Fusarium odoratissimum NRRL 54006]EXM09072.1 hypothetical protein FOIG_02050 [Fusarium odoratissimum NRRL 54006]TXC05878.1 hypothetical protein FocTR4_00009934 [Fusarium oxysporum f. sp. cubense]
MFTAMSNVVAEYSLFTSIISMHQSFKLPYATWTGYKLSWVTHCRGLWQGASLELHASPTLHLPISTTPSRRTTRDNPGLPLPAFRSITGLGDDGIFEVDRWTLNLKQGLPTKMQCSTWNSVAYCMHWDTSLVMLFRRL